MSDTKPPPPKKAIIELGRVMDPDQMKLLARLLTEAIGDSGYGKVTITVYNKNIVGMDTTKTYRGG